MKHGVFVLEFETYGRITFSVSKIHEKDEKLAKKRLFMAKN
jgi:hypothetical protein